MGKSTQSRLLEAYLLATGHKVTWTREPGGTPLGVKIRQLLLTESNHLSKATELMLFHADRAQHYKEVLKPAIRAGYIVICDRYADSTLAYQGAGRGWSRKDLAVLHRLTTGSLTPDLTIILMAESHKVLDVSDTFEQEASDFHARIYTEYERLCAEGGRYVRIDGNRPKDVIAAEIKATVLDRLNTSTTLV